jgi:hypothetical protein
MLNMPIFKCCLIFIFLSQNTMLAKQNRQADFSLHFQVVISVILVSVSESVIRAGSNFSWLPVCLGLWPLPPLLNHNNLCFCHHITLSSDYSSCILLKRSVMTAGAMAHTSHHSYLVIQVGEQWSRPA